MPAFAHALVPLGGANTSATSLAEEMEEAKDDGEATGGEASGGAKDKGEEAKEEGEETKSTRGTAFFPLFFLVYNSSFCLHIFHDPPDSARTFY